MDERVKDYLRRWGVPRRFTEAWLPEDAAGLVAPNADGLFLCGPAGVGKSWLAAAWLRRLARRKAERSEDGRVTAVWCSVPQFLQELRATFNGRGSEAEVTGQYTRPDLLVLDDLGAEHSTDWTGQAVYMVIAKRLDDCLQTIVTSNLTLEELDKRDPRLASRLGALAYHRMEGRDRRLAGEVKTEVARA